MGYWKWKKREKGSERQGGRWPIRKERHDRPMPPSSHDAQLDSVPNWEKRFCSQMPWSDFCDKKRVAHLFPKVLNWDDSAGKEAFGNAKARFWAEINNVPPEILPPDPDMYVDEIDFDAYINPLLIKDLYERPPPPPIPEIPDLSLILIAPTGWDVVDPPLAGNIPEFICTEPDVTCALDGEDQNPKNCINGSELVNCSFGRMHSGVLGCHEQGYQMDRWTKYTAEQCFWHQKPSFGRGLSCAP